MEGLHCYFALERKFVQLQHPPHCADLDLNVGVNRFLNVNGCIVTQAVKGVFVFVTVQAKALKVPLLIFPQSILAKGPASRGAGGDGYSEKRQFFSNAVSNVFSFLLGAHKRRGCSDDRWSRMFRQKYPFCILPTLHGIQKKYRHALEAFQLEKVFVFRHQ